MGVFKFTRSGKALQFVTDEGVVYQSAVELIKNLADGKNKSGFVPATRLSVPVEENRFPKSVVWGEEPSKDLFDKPIDPMGHKAARLKEEAKVVGDAKVEW